MEIEEYVEEVSEMFKSIGHPIRMTILIGLARRRSCVRDIWDCLGLPQATVSQHLAVLKNKKIVGVKKLGVKREYYISNPLIEKIINVISNETENNEKR